MTDVIWGPGWGPGTEKEHEMKTKETQNRKAALTLLCFLPSENRLHGSAGPGDDGASGR